MKLNLQTQSFPKAKLLAASLVGAIAGGAVMVAILTPEPQVIYREAASAVTPIATAEAMPVIETALSVEGTSAEVKLTDRERQVLARLASLPDLPLVQAPAFDVKVQKAPADTKPSTAKVAAAKKPAAEPAPPAGESVIARIQVVSVEKGRVFYRSVDDQMHTARVGERLLGVNGRVIAIDEHGAELQIEGQRMRVAANNM